MRKLLSALACVCACALATPVAADPAPAFVSIDYFDAHRGLQHLDCWLTLLVYDYPTVTLDCHSDIELIFVNGFEP